jgi:hypothetical protein
MIKSVEVVFSGRFILSWLTEDQKSLIDPEAKPPLRTREKVQGDSSIRLACRANGRLRICIKTPSEERPDIVLDLSIAPLQRGVQPLIDHATISEAKPRGRLYEHAADFVARTGA